MKNKRSDNLAFWLKQPNGFIRDKETIISLQEHSESLDTLYRKGIDITSIYKFSPTEERISLLIGEVFFEDPKVIEDLKKGISKNKPIGKIRVRGELFYKTMKLLRELAKLNLIDNDFAFEKYARKNGEIVYELANERQIKKIVNYNKRQHVKICFSFTYDTTWRDFVVGHWFNAYSYKIIYEHLKRNRFDFEIYSRVEYKAPSDIFNGTGDFDILALVNDKILTVECKFGKLDNRNRNSIEKNVIQKSNSLKNVFDVTARKFDYIPILIYNNKNVRKPEFLAKIFKDSDFHLIDIGDLRSSIVDVFTDNIEHANGVKEDIKTEKKTPKPKEEDVPPKSSSKPKRTFWQRFFSLFF